LFTPDGKVSHSYSERGSHDDFDDDEDEEHESEENEFSGEITHEGNKIQVMRNQWRERATVKDQCKGHINDTDLVYGLTDHRENEKIDTFDYIEYKPPKGKANAHKWIATKEISLHFIRY